MYDLPSSGFLSLLTLRCEHAMDVSWVALQILVELVFLLF